MSESGNPWIAPGSAHAARRGGPNASEIAEAAHRQAVEEHAVAMRIWEAEQVRLDEEEEQLERLQEASVSSKAEDGNVEEDPFGLESLMEVPPPPPMSRPGDSKRRAPPPAPPPPRSSFMAAAVPITSAWDTIETICMRREAVIQVCTGHY